MNNFPDYEVVMEETHHIHKLDAPSGTAITLAEDIIANIKRKNSWALYNDTDDNKSDIIEIKDYREGEVPGIHSVIYESDVDSIKITHNAKSRRGFALGAVLAAEFTKDKKGFLGMQDLLGSL
jgi:4-hydroxy-tetrahydrodipicolinate reductase